MRISDWSSDVCSSDLRRWLGAYEFRPHHDDPGSIPGGNGGGLERRTRTAATGDRPAGRAYAPAPRRGPVAARGGGGAVAAVAKNEAEMSGHGFAGALRERVTVEPIGSASCRERVGTYV